jgi:hypothetical protein
MRLKRAAILTSAAALGLVAICAHAQDHTAVRLGTAATRFAPKPLTKSGDVRVLLRGDKTRDDVSAILSGAGWRGGLEDFDRAAATAEITELRIAPGTRLPFMASRSKGRDRKPYALMNVLWAGREPIEAWAFEFSSSCTRYRVVVPRLCGNFWVEDRGKDETGPCASRQGLAPAVSVGLPREACVAQPVAVTVDVRSASPDGKVVLAVNGRQVASGVLAGGKFSATLPGFSQPGTYEVTANAGGASGATSVSVKACLPTCAITVLPHEAKVGQRIRFDLTGSSVAPGAQGGVKLARVEIVRGDAVVETVTLSAPVLSRSDVVLRKGGAYTLRAVVTDAAGRVSTNSCQASVDVKGGLPLFLGAYFGKERMLHDSGPGSPGARCAPLVGVEIGFQPKLGASAELEVALGGKFDTRDSKNSSLFGDVALNYLFARGFVGGGVSAWDLTLDTGSRSVAFLIQGGVDLNRRGSFQLVAQARAPLNELGALDDNYQFWGGLRFRPFR